MCVCGVTRNRTPRTTGRPLTLPTRTPTIPGLAASVTYSSADSIELPRSNVHLYQQMVARGLYSPMLEWWCVSGPRVSCEVSCVCYSPNDARLCIHQRVAMTIVL